MRQVLKVVLPVLGALFLLPSLAYAQTGSVAGQVRDTSGGALPGVTVEVTSPALIEKVRSSTTDDNGRYQITALPVGTYEVTFTLESFATVKRPNIVVTSNFTANVPADMSVGALKDTVNVVAESPVVDVQNARVQHVFQGAEIAELPTQRDIPSILNLVPSFQASSLRGACSGGVGGFCNPTVPLFNTHTGAGDTDGQNQGRIMVDGMSINMGRAGTGINENVGLANGIVLDTAAAQEVSFTLSGSLGESETGGAAINIVPRTGGNRFAGNYFTSYTQTRFFDRNRGTRVIFSPTGTGVGPASQAFNYDYDITGAFGGPIRKDVLWFYLQTRKQARNTFPNGGSEPGFMNLNEGKWGANYVPNRTCTAPRSCGENGWLTYTNEYKNASARITLQATQRNKFNIYWDEQDACTNPCDGMINIVDSPESYFTLQSRPNRLMQLSWTNPFTSRLLFDAGLTVVATHQDQTKSREFANPRTIPRICEVGTTVGRDGVSSKVNSAVPNDWPQGTPSAGTCNVFSTMISGSLNDGFPGFTPNTLVNDDTYRSRASASYITGSHNAKIGFDGAYFSEKIRNEANDVRLNYHYITPATTGTWNATTRTGNCLLADPSDIYACGNMTLYNPEDPTNRLFFRPRPVGFRMNTGVGKTDERVWFGALYVQDQWTLNRFTLNGAIRLDHAESRYGASCIGPDVFVPNDAAQPTGSWCSEPSKGVRYNDITPRWGVAWDVFGNGKTSVKWNMGKYLQAAGFGSLYTNFNDARRSTNELVRNWDDLNGNRIVECDHTRADPHTSPQGDFCGTLLGTNGLPSAEFLQFGRAPNANQLANANSSCGLKNSPQSHVDYCLEADQNLMQGWGKRRNEWQFGLGIQHELLPRFSAEVTYNRRKYGNLTDSDTINLGCDYYGPRSREIPTTTCTQGWQNYTDPTGTYDFYKVTVPVDTRLPEGGGYQLRGLVNQKIAASLPTGGGNITLLRKELDYTWNGVDTNFVLRARGGLRVSGGTSTGRVLRNLCDVATDNPAPPPPFGLPNGMQGREGNEFRGGCNEYRPFQTNVRANASYTIPFIDVLTGVVFQYRPGPERSANITIPNTAAQWEAGSENRAGTLFNTTTGTTATQGNVNLLDDGDLFGEGLRLWDLNFSKNIRFAGKRLNLGVNVYNLFNSDGALTYQNNYTAFYIPETGGWVEDNPATPDVEYNDWGRITQITNPRFMRFTVSFDF